MGNDAYLLVVFGIAMAILLVSIIKFKANAFIALLLTAVGTGLLTGMQTSQISTVIGNGFGSTMTSIGIIVGLGVMLGRFLYESGSIEVIADTLVGKFKGQKSRIAVGLAGFITGIPVFGDIVHIMYAPLVRAISKKSNVSLVSLCSATVCCTVLAGAMIIPTPNPLAVAANLELDYGVFFLYALFAGLFGSIFVMIYSKWLDKHDTKLGITYDFSDEDLEMKTVQTKNGKKIPFVGALSILFVPIFLILIGSFVPMSLSSDLLFTKICSFLGNKNISMLIGVIYAALYTKPYREKSAASIMDAAAGQVGLVLLVTGAGGAFGKMLQATGIADSLANTLAGFNMPLLVLLFIVAQILRCAQGSTGVALITTSSMFSSMIASSGVSPILCGIAICAGGIGLSLPNDSGFWNINKFYKISVQDTMRAWTVGGFIAGLGALLFCCIIQPFQAVLPGLI